MSVQIEEGSHTLKDGMKLYTKTWKPRSAPKARILFIHGFSDHCNNYEYLFNSLASRGIEIYGFDQRGWGRTVQSKSQRGLTGPTTTVISDISSMLETILPSPVPVFIMGHSMGGAETLIYATQGPKSLVSQVRGFIASAPLVALHPTTKPWKITVIAGRIASHILPKHHLVNPLDEQWLTHDAAQNALWAADELCHDTGTLEGLAGMLDRGEALDSGKAVIPEGVGEGGKTRLLFLHGTDDHINDFNSTKQFYERCKIGDKTFKAYDGLYHNLHAESGDDKLTFANDVFEWLSNRLDDSAHPSSSSSSQSKL